MLFAMEDTSGRGRFGLSRSQIDKRSWRLGDELGAVRDSAPPCFDRRRDGGVRGPVRGSSARRQRSPSRRNTRIHRSEPKRRETLRLFARSAGRKPRARARNAPWRGYSRHVRGSSRRFRCIARRRRRRVARPTGARGDSPRELSLRSVETGQNALTRERKGPRAKRCNTSEKAS